MLNSEKIRGDLLIDLTNKYPAFDAQVVSSLYPLVNSAQVCELVLGGASNIGSVTIKKPAITIAHKGAAFLGNFSCAASLMEPALELLEADTEDFLVFPYSIGKELHFNGVYYVVKPIFGKDCEIQIHAPIVSKADRIFAQAQVLAAFLVNTLVPDKVQNSSLLYTL